VTERTKKLLIFVLKLVVTATMIGFVFANLSAGGQDLDWSDLPHALGQISLSAWALGGLLLGTSFVFSGLQWWFLLRRLGVDVSWLRALRFYFIGLFFNNFLIGNVGGDLKKIYDIHRDSSKLAAAVTATLFDRIFGLFVINGICLVAFAIWFENDDAMNGLGLPSMGIFTAMICFFCVLFSKRLGQMAESFLVRLRLRRPAQMLASLRECFQALRSPGFLFSVLILSCVIQLERIGVQWVLGEDMGLGLSISVYLLFVPLIGIVSALPISVGGFGPRELLAQSLFARVGIQPWPATVLQLAATLLGMFISLIGALDFLFGRRSRRTVKDGDKVS
jgi:uncharacterized membrane protein YbhN (UPF0104 family)